MFAGLAALLLAYHYGQGWWSLVWMVLAGGLSQPLVNYTKISSGR